MKKHLSLAVVAAAALLMASNAQASLIWFNPVDPTAAAPATLGQYTMTAFGDDVRPNGSLVSDVDSPLALGGVVGFSPDLTHAEVGVGLGNLEPRLHWRRLHHQWDHAHADAAFGHRRVLLLCGAQRFRRLHDHGRG